MDYRPGEELPQMLWKNSIHEKVRRLCSVLEHSGAELSAIQVHELREMELPQEAIDLIATLATSGYWNIDQYELEGQLGRYWWVHPETNQVEVNRKIRETMYPEVAQILSYLLL